MTQEHLDHILDIRKKAYYCREDMRKCLALIGEFKNVLESTGVNARSLYNRAVLLPDFGADEEFDRLKTVICHAAIDMLKILADEKENDAKELDKIFEKL